MRQELKDIEKEMNEALAALKERFKTLRTGRANLGMLDGILVSAYGTDVPMNQVANLSVPDPTLIVATPWDPKMAVEIERAVRKSELGLNPQSDGKVVRIPVPSLTEDRRKDLAKKAHHMAEEARVEIRRFRRGKRSLEEAVQGQDDLGRRRAPRPRGVPEAHRPEDQGSRRPAESEGAGDPGRLELRLLLCFSIHGSSGRFSPSSCPSIGLSRFAGKTGS